jgi:RHS repeat-associated protein
MILKKGLMSVILRARAMRGTYRRLFQVIVCLCIAGLAAHAQVTISPKQLKQAAVATLQGISTTDKDLQKKISSAVDAITQSLSNKTTDFFLDDWRIVPPPNGVKVFDQEQKAADVLGGLLKDGNTSASIRSTLQSVLNTLVQADREIAERSLVTAERFVKAGEGDAKVVTRARQQFDQAAKETNAKEAIDGFKTSWQSSQEVANQNGLVITVFRDGPSLFSSRITSNKLTATFQIVKSDNGDGNGNSSGKSTSQQSFEFIEIIQDASTGATIRKITTTQDVPAFPQGGDDSSNAPPWSVTLTSSWDGKDNSGQIARDGTYNYIAFGRIVKPSDGKSGKDDKNNGNKDDTNDQNIVALAFPVSDSVTLDSTPPNITAVRDKLPNAAGWNNTDVTLSFVCTDAIDGVTCPAPVTVTTEGANQLISGTAVDVAGNTGSVTVILNIDKTPPLIAPVQAPLANTRGWNNSNVTVSFAASDALSGLANVTAPVVIQIEGANQRITGTAVDVAGNVAIATAAINLDKTPPVLAFGAAAPGPNAAGWNNTNVAFSFTTTDNLSGVAATSTPSPLTLITEGSAVTGAVTVTDVAGNSATFPSPTVKIDKTPPTVLFLPGVPAPNAAGWNNTDVCFTYTVTDSLSGIPPISVALFQPLCVTTEGSSVTGSVTVGDVAGNTTTFTTPAVKIDKTPPTVQPAASPQANVAGWNNTNVTVSFPGTDALSGIASCSVPVLLSTEGRNQSASGTCTDSAGNVSPAASVAGINIDKTPPTLAFGDATPPANAAGWNNGNVAFPFTPADALSGVASTSVPSPLTLATEGTAVTGTVTVTDVAGNTATFISPTVKIDKIPPTLTYGPASPAANAAGWNNTNVSFGFTTADNLSGVASTSVPSPLLLSTEGTSVTGNVTVTDVAGNTATFTSPVVKIEKTPPTAQAAASPQPNAAGWNKTNVTVSFTGTNALSGITSCSAAVVLSTEGRNQSASGTCTDNAGNVSQPASVSGINIDKTLPALTFGAATPAPNAAGWNNTNVALPFTPADALSGVASTSVPSPLALTTEGIAVTGTVTVTDVAGNTATFTSPAFKIDKTPPTLTYGSASPAANAAGWNKTNVTFAFSPADALSGVASTSIPSPLTLTSEGNAVNGSVTVTDVADNTATFASPTVKIDKTAPAAQAAASPQANAAGWNNTNVAVSFTGTDALSGIASCSPDVVLSNEGKNQSASGSCTDNAGNVSTPANIAGINIDKTPPALTFGTADPAPNGAGWNKTDVNFTFTTADNLSGVASTSVPSPLSLTMEGSSVTGTVTVTDVAGNAAGFTSPSVKIDKTPPVIVIASPSEAATLLTASVAVTGTVTDAVSGVSTVSCNGAAVTPVQPSLNCTVPLVPQANSLVVQATDLAGNSQSSTTHVTYIPAPTITSIDRASGQQGQTLTVTLTGTNFVSGLTQASFGDGIAVAGAAPGGFGPLMVSSTTSGTVQIVISSTATRGPRNVVMQNGSQQASLTGGFMVTPSGPTITDFNPKSTTSGTLVTLSGDNLTPNPVVTLNQQGGGTVNAPITNIQAASITFVVPAGAATGPITVTVNSASGVSASVLTITPSQDFQVSILPAAVDLIEGQSATFTVNLTGASSFLQPASLQIGGLPSGITATFDPQTITGGEASTLRLSAPLGQAAGQTTLTITASATVDSIPLSRTGTAQINSRSATTSLIGRTVVDDRLETPLAGVTVKMLGKNGEGGTTTCAGTTVSDDAGNFELTGLGPECTGPQLVGYDGLTVRSPAGKYAGVNLVYTLKSNQVTASPVLVHLPRIDDKETFYVQQNFPADQSYSYTTIPGLAVTVYRGTTFTLPDGSTPNPFPLVAIQVPVDRLPDAKPPVPTMVTSFIVAFQPANTVASKPAAVFYPNTLNTPPGTSVALMTLDPTRGRMLPYGTATVSTDGTQIIPDPNPSIPGTRYGIVNFDWHGSPGPPGTGLNPPPGPFVGTCNPCNFATGLETIRATDISFGGMRGGITLVRTYQTLATNPGPFGIGSSHNFQYFLDTADPQNQLLVNLILPTGSRLPLSRQSTADPFVNTTIEMLRGATMTASADAQAFLRLKDGTTYRFRSFGPLGSALVSITDSNGNTTTLDRDNRTSVTKITDAVGRSLALAYDPINPSRIVSITDPIGRVVQYTYNGDVLETVTDPDGGVTRYEYDSQNRLISETNPRGVVVAQNTYDQVEQVSPDAAGATVQTYVHPSVIQQTYADGSSLKFKYRYLNPTVLLSPALTTDVTDSMGRVTHYEFDPTGLLTSIKDATSHWRLFVRDPQKANQIVAYKEGQAVWHAPNSGSATPGDMSFDYDDRGNMTQRTDALGNTDTYTYDPVFNKPTSITDPLGNITKFTYDDRGNVLTGTDANGKTTSYKYDPFGLLIEISDPLGQKTTLEYDSYGNLGKITDALSHTTQFRYDAVSRLIQVKDALGRTSTLDYDKLNRVVKQTDGKGQVTTLAYDAVGNVTSLTDARGKTTRFTYDGMNRLKTRTDPLGKSDTRNYDLNGDLTSFTDRKGQTSTFVYDPLNRLIEEHYADGAVVKRSYNVNGWLTQVIDSQGGAFTFEYDLTGALLKTNSPTGAVTYVRDPLHRAQHRQVLGQPAEDFTYDPVGNLVSAAFPQAAVNFTYDALNRPLNLTRSNGVTTAYSYDPVGRLLSIVHGRGTTTLQTLNYSYDVGGNRISQQASSAQSLITPATLDTFDDANRLIQHGSTHLTYDDNGNLLSETSPGGTTTYTWDARNRLQAVADTTDFHIHLQYDFAGNLLNRVVGLAPGFSGITTYTLDEFTNVASIRAASVTLSVLTGDWIDSHFATIGSNGQVEYALADAINSTVATADQSGTEEEQSSYEPFGETAATASTYPFQYTGRTPISQSLYYYRARYYKPQIGRFISEDPSGDYSDTDLYVYVANDPQERIDPSGQDWVYVQSTGDLEQIDPQSGVEYYVDRGFSGGGLCGCRGRNDPSMEDVKDFGPIPAGSYHIGPQGTHVTRKGKVLPRSMRLTDFPGNKKIRPGGYLLHAGRRSQGCIILHPAILDLIGSSGDKVLRVVRSWEDVLPGYDILP